VFTKIDPTKGATIVGTEGTIVRIPPDAFTTSLGYPVNGPVIFEMKDIAKREDILLTNVPTVSNGEVLESGGVVYLNARADGRPLKIAKDKSLEVEFPQERTKEGMMGFSGKYDSNKKMNWDPLESPLTADPASLVFKDGKHTVQGYVSSLIKKYSPCTGPSTLQVKIKFDPQTGRTDYVRLIGQGGHCYDRQVTEVVRELFWKGETEKTGEFEFQLELNNSAASGTKPMLRGPIPADEAFAHYDPEYMNAIDEKRAGELANNTLQVTGLGWVNWDCYPSPPETENFFVQVKGGKEKEFARIFVVYRDRNIVLDAKQVGSGKFEFEQVPVGIPGYVVGVSYLKEKPYLAVQSLESIGDDQQFAMERTTIDELKATVARYVGAN
jgi:hypothetical protein